MGDAGAMQAVLAGGNVFRRLITDWQMAVRAFLVDGGNSVWLSSIGEII